MNTDETRTIEGNADSGLWVVIPCSLVGGYGRFHLLHNLVGMTSFWNIGGPTKRLALNCTILLRLLYKSQWRHCSQIRDFVPTEV